MSNLFWMIGTKYQAILPQSDVFFFKKPLQFCVIQIFLYLMIENLFLIWDNKTDWNSKQSNASSARGTMSGNFTKKLQEGSSIEILKKKYYSAETAALLSTCFLDEGVCRLLLPFKLWNSTQTPILPQIFASTINRSAELWQGTTFSFCFIIIIGCNLWRENKSSK